MPLGAFTEETFSGLEQGEENIAVGISKETWGALEPLRFKMFQSFMESIREDAPTLA